MSPVLSRFTGIIILLIVLGVLFYPGYAVLASTTPRADLWVTNGPVYSTLLNQSTLYLGGDFSYVGPSTGSAVAINSTNGTIDSDFPKFNGTVDVVIPDGAGGWYIGGTFNKVDSVTRNNIAHIQADMTVAAWSPDISGGGVSAVLLNGTTLYVGGDFTSVDGQGRNRLAALDTTATTAGTYTTAWNPGIADNSVRTMVLNGTTLYVGGDFTAIDGQGRNRLAALDTTATTAGTYTTAWNPDTDGVVNVLNFGVPPTLYVGGDFMSIDSIKRNRLAAVDVTATTAGSYTQSWNPSAGNEVKALTRFTSTVVAGGSFLSVGGQTRNNLAAFGIQVGAVTSFNPNVNDIVRAMAVTNDSTTLYIGGDFTTVGLQTRNHLAAVNGTTGIITSWDPDADNVVRDIKLSNDESTLYIAGDFTSLTTGANVRQHIAAIDTTTAVPTPWAPDANDVVRSITLTSDGSLLYAGGNFTVIGLQARSNLAALSTTSGAAIPSWIPTSSTVYTTRLSSDGSILYVGGVNELAAFNELDGSAVPSFNPGAVAGTVETLELSTDDQMLYAGGGLNSIGGQLRDNIARYDLVGDALTAWDPGTDAAVHHLALSTSGSPLYVAGDFTRIGGDDLRPGLASVPMLPPTTAITPAAGAYSTSQDVTLSCTDNSGTGCAETYYTLDGSNPTGASTPYSTNNPIVIPSDSAITVKYFSIDNEGSYETFKTADFVVDTTAPTTVATPGAGSYNGNGVPISLICTDAGGSGCGATYYTTDGSTPTTASTLYTGPIPLASLEGITDLRFFSVDNAGNVESVINSVNYVIDITQPIIAFSLLSGTYPPPKTIAMTCDDGNGSGCDEIYYTTDLTAPTVQSTKYSDTGPLILFSGTVIRAIAVDIAGNPSPEIVGIYTFTIGAGETTSGTGSVDPLLLLLVINGMVLRTWRVIKLRRT